MELFNCILSVAIINCCYVSYCKGVDITLGNTEDFFSPKEQSLKIRCILNSGTLDNSLLRSWTKNSITLINSGISTSAGIGYSESLGSDSFSLTTPVLDYSFDGSVYQCNYLFSQATLNLKIYHIEGTAQSKGDCIVGKSIDQCWFSVLKVIPAVSSQNLTISYVDGTMEDITPMLNVTSRLNADGKTWTHDFIIEPTLISKDVKAIMLSFIAGPISRTLTIVSEGCKYSDVELIFGGVSCFLIVLITSIIMLIIQGCKILLEIFGDIKPNKVIIIIVFDLVALIIGLALGFSLKECDQRDLGLGLGLGFGFILAIALVVTLYIYHKKCGSKKENEDENGKKPEDNPQRVGLKS